MSFLWQFSKNLFFGSNPEAIEDSESNCQKIGKKAVLIGCNYPGTKAELRGCINDVKRMHQCLIQRYGFSDDNIEILIDTDDSYPQPTGRNIRCALARLVRSADPGDFLFVHYSGHGTRLPAETNNNDDTGYDECIVPSDMNLITDDYFKELVNQVPEGCRLTIVSDSCHSGGLIMGEKEQYGVSTNVNNKHKEKEVERVNVIPRSLPLSTLAAILKQKTGKDDIDVENLRPTLFDVFKEDPSLRAKKLTRETMENFEGIENGRYAGGYLGVVDRLAKEFLKQKLDEEDDKDCVKPCLNTGSFIRAVSNGGILISGCQSDQTSADAMPSGKADAAYGALSNAIQTILCECDWSITNKELVLMVRNKLKRQNFTQTPGLYCSDDHLDAPFLC